MAIELGKINTLVVKRCVDFGLYLSAQDDDLEVLMPRRYTTREMRVGDLVDVFVYNVSDDRMVLIARDIAKKIEEELEYPGQIKVNVVRESRAVDFAK